MNDYGFTSREMTVLDALAEGYMTDKAIAERLLISPKSVNVYVDSIRSKLEAHFEERWRRAHITTWWKAEKDKAS